MAWTKEDLLKMNLTSDGKGGYRPMTKKEIALSKMPKSKDTVYQYNIEAIDKSCLLFIPGDVMSKKNSKQMVTLKDGRKFLISSKYVKNYEDSTKHYWKNLRNRFLAEIQNKEKPYNIEFHFVFSSKRKRDYCNMIQLPLDLMQEHEWLEDDDMDTVLPIYKPYSVDRFNPGLYIKIK